MIPFYRNICIGIILASLLSISGTSVLSQDFSPKPERPPMREDDNVYPPKIQRKIVKLLAELRELAATGKMNENREFMEKIGQLEQEFKSNTERDPVSPKQRLKANRPNQLRGPSGDRLAMEDKLRQIGKELEELRRAGLHEEANQLEQKARQLKERLAADQFGQPQGPPGDMRTLEEKVRGLGKEMEELRRQGREDEANQLDQKIRNLKEQMDRGSSSFESHPQEIERRVQNLQVAMKNLHAAGLHEVANDVQRQLEQLKRQGPPQGGSMPRQMEVMIKERIEQMQQQIDELRDAVQEMRQRNFEGNR